jgi:hypothetical protein
MDLNGCVENEVVDSAAVGKSHATKKKPQAHSFPPHVEIRGKVGECRRWAPGCWGGRHPSDGPGGKKDTLESALTGRWLVVRPEIVEKAYRVFVDDETSIRRAPKRA